MVARWKKVKRMCLYSTDRATKHKHDKYCLETKALKAAEKKDFGQARETSS